MSAPLRIRSMSIPTEKQFDEFIAKWHADHRGRYTSALDYFRAVWSEAQAESTDAVSALRELRLVIPHFWNDENAHISELDVACGKADVILNKRTA